jgi:hydrogenase nickel incorporation protein HypB
VCDTCGCSDDAGVRVVVPGSSAELSPHTHGSGQLHAHGSDHSHGSGQLHAHGSDHSHDSGDTHGVSTPPASRTIAIERNLLEKNDDLAGHSRKWFAQHDMAVLNVMSSPGAGKTSLLERTIREAGSRRTMCVVEGDQETVFDAERIKATGAPVVQINTGAGCHLDADMLWRGLATLRPPDGSLLFVENVGNLVCPALFDLGEAAKVVIISVTEGDDKPLKYPHMFAAADLVVINKTDLLPYVDFDVNRCIEDARSLNPAVTAFPLSVRTGAGLTPWFEWLDAFPSVR